jgi:hypothetical protein
VSAWIVSRAHIDALVLAGVQFGLATQPTPQALAAVGTGLWQANHASVNHHYHQIHLAPAYPAPTATVVLDPVTVVKLIDCYVYQSCEHPGWQTSPAAEFCRRLREILMRDLPIDTALDHRGPYPIGWQDAPWGIDHLHQAAIRPASIPPAPTDGTRRAAGSAEGGPR